MRRSIDMKPSERLIVALDVSTLEEAKKLVQTLSPLVNIFKVGKELFTAAGPDVVRMLNRQKMKVFLDLKYHDIPNTVAATCREAVKLGVFMLNVHTTGGERMLKEAAASIEAKPGLPKPLLIGVTVLTSLSQEDLKAVGISKDLKTQVADLALLAKKCGLQGVVASAQEIDLIREKCGKDFVLVVPGVRPVWAQANDQKRSLTPKEAIEKGADFIVVGRPITHAEHPLEAAQKIIEEISESR